MMLLMTSSSLLWGEQECGSSAASVFAIFRAFCGRFFLFCNNIGWLTTFYILQQEEKNQLKMRFFMNYGKILPRMDTI